MYDQVVRPGTGDIVQRGLGEVAMRIEESKSLPGGEVLPDQVEEKGALAGSGLPDDVEVPAPFLLVEHDIIAQRMGANAELLAWCIHGRKGAGVPCASQVGDDAGSTLIPLRVRRGYMASRRCA